MTRLLIIFVFLNFISIISIGQRMGDYYVPVSIDSAQGGRLRFLTDSTVELSTLPQHMSRSLKVIYKYISTDTAIQISPYPLNTSGISPIGETILTKIKGGFINYEKLLIYVRQKDFDKYPDIIYLIDGKRYIQDTGELNGYGLVRKSQKINKRLQRKMKSLSDGNFTIELVKGLNAYKRFGIKYVFGTIVITTKK
ncbi:MAG: hypothetical protein JNL23_10730 [Chitinophagaceae bacterium]|nr:hypothetical protein [Chitinophagaceae bacterium]